MSHSTQLHRDGDTSIIAIHNSDWSGDTIFRIIRDPFTSQGSILSEIVLPQAAVEALVQAQLEATLSEEEREVAARLFAIGKCL